MKIREQRSMLKEAGYELKRRGTKHELWTNGRDMVPVSSTVNSDHTRKAFLVKIKRAREERKRVEREQSAQKPLTNNLGSLMRATVIDPPVPMHLPRPELHMATAKKRVFELKEQGKSTEDAVTVVMTAFDLKTGYGRPVPRETFLAYVEKPYPPRASKVVEEMPFKETAPKEKPKTEKKQSGDVDEVLEHVRSVISLPFEKDKKIEIIFDLLDKIL